MYISNGAATYKIMIISDYTMTSIIICITIHYTPTLVSTHVHTHTHTHTHVHTHTHTHTHADVF